MPKPIDFGQGAALLLKASLSSWRERGTPFFGPRNAEWSWLFGLFGATCLLELNPDGVLAPVRQRCFQVPNPDAHPSGARDQVETPFAAGQLELIAQRPCAWRRGSHRQRCGCRGTEFH